LACRPCRRECRLSELGAERLVFPDHALHADEIDQTLEVVLGADRKLDRNRLGAEAVNDIGEHLKKSAPVLSILLAKTMRGTLYLSPWRQTVSVCGSTPWLESSTHTAPSSTRKLTLDFDGEVDVAGGVDDVQALAVPERGGRSGGDRDATLLLLLHPVHRRGTFVHFADLVALAGVIKDALGGRGLAGIDMRHNTEITVVLYGMNAGHGLFLKSVFRRYQR
jgi:hypothetical protein